MKNVYNVNGLPFWNAAEIAEREHLVRVFPLYLEEFLRKENAAWHMHRIEAPVLTPHDQINPNYTDNDVFFTSDKLVMRPETTPGSYAYAKHLLETQTDRPPFVVWQVGKSFRREQDQVQKNMRLKEFYQMEFQCLFTDDTKNDYMEAVLPRLGVVFGAMLGRNIRIIESDRLPSYSLKTMDIEAELPHKWMEMASISLRNDFPAKFTYTTGKGSFTKNILVLEVAIGVDRCVYAKLLPKDDDASEEGTNRGEVG